MTCNKHLPVCVFLHKMSIFLCCPNRDISTPSISRPQHECETIYSIWKFTNATCTSVIFWSEMVASDFSSRVHAETLNIFPSRPMHVVAEPSPKAATSASNIIAAGSNLKPQRPIKTACRNCVGQWDFTTSWMETTSDVNPNGQRLGRGGDSRNVMSRRGRTAMAVGGGGGAGGGGGGVGGRGGSAATLRCGTAAAVRARRG